MKDSVKQTRYLRIVALILGILMLLPMAWLPVAAQGEVQTQIDPATVPGVFFNSNKVVAGMSSTSVKLTAEPGFMRCVTTGEGANIRINLIDANIVESEYPYMVIRYRTTADSVNDWIFLTSGEINAGYVPTDGAVVHPDFEKGDEWHNKVYCIAEDFPKLIGKTFEWLRIPVAAGNGEVFDISHVAFFKSAEDAARFEGYVSNNGCATIGLTWINATLTSPKTCAVCGETEGEPLPPVDPANVPGVSFNNEPNSLKVILNGGVIISQEDGFMRATTSNAGDVWWGVSVSVKTAEYPYMAIRYRISGNHSSNWLYLTDDRVNPGYSATTGTWGSPKFMCDNEWHTSVYNFADEFSAMADVNLTSIRLPGAADTNGYLDIAYVAFFKTEEEANAFEGYPERTECEKNGHSWKPGSCLSPKTCSVCGITEGNTMAHAWADATCIAPKTCTACGETEGEAKGHAWMDATCTAPKTCSSCQTTEGEAVGHMWTEATCTAPKTCSVCQITEGEAAGHIWVDSADGFTKTCSVCDATETLQPDVESESATVEGTQGTDPVGTDMTVGLILAIVGMLIAVAWLVVSIILKNKNKLSGWVFLLNIGLAALLLIAGIVIAAILPSLSKAQLPSSETTAPVTEDSDPALPTDSATPTDSANPDDTTDPSNPSVGTPDPEFLYSGSYSEKNGALAGIDNLSRILPEEGEKKERTVGIFYFLGSEGNVNAQVGDVSKVLAKDPLAYESVNQWLAAGGQYGTSMYWGEPLFGYYSHEDDWVIHKHVQMFIDAGIDYIIFDTTNEYICAPNVMKVLRVLDYYYQQGLKAPQVAFYTHTSSGKIAMMIYDQIYKPNLDRYAHLWFHWDGKPMIIAEPDAEELTDEFKDFFCIKTPVWPNDTSWDAANAWPWMEFSRLYTRTAIYGKRTEDGERRKEVISVSVAQHCDTIMFSQTAFYGGNDHTRSWHNGANDPAPDAYLYGYNLSEQFEWAIEQDPETIFITGWNEWAAVCTYMREDCGPIQMCDCVTANCSRDIEPMMGGYEDNYYMQMCKYIRLYKGCEDRVNVGEDKTVDVTGSFAQFNDATAVYTDPVGDTVARDHAGWGEYFTDNSGRNDIVEIRVMKDQANYYVYIRTAENLTEPTAEGWMTLFIDSGCEGGLGGAWDIAVNRTAPVNGKTNIEKYENGAWTVIGTADIRYEGNQMMLSMDRLTVDASAEIGLCDIRFKVADNYTQNEVMSFYTSGDCAPYGRLSFVFSNKK